MGGSSGRVGTEGLPATVLPEGGSNGLGGTEGLPATDPLGGSSGLVDEGSLGIACLCEGGNIGGLVRPTPSLGVACL